MEPPFLAADTMAEGVEGFVLLALMLVIIILRSIVRVRRVGFGGLDLDDYLMPLAGVGQQFSSQYSISINGPRLISYPCHRYSAQLSRWQRHSSSVRPRASPTAT